MKLHLKHLCVTVLSILFLCINVFADPDQFTVSVSNGNKFTISRTDASAASYVDYYTQSGSAVAGIHYVEKSGRLVFNAGETTKTVTIDLYSLRKTIDDYAKNSELRKYFFVVYNNYMSPIRTEGYFSTGNSYSEPPERQITICDSYTQHDKLAYETASQCLRNVHSPTDEEYYTITQQTPKYKFNVSFDTYEVVDGYYFIGIYLNGNKSDPYKSNGLAAVPSGASQNIYNACWERNGRVGNTYKIKFPVKGMGQSDNTINAFVWNNSSYWSIGNTNDYLYSQYFNAYYYSGWSSSDGYFIESDGTKKVGIALNASGQDDDAFYIGNPVVNVKLYDDVAPVITGIYINTSHIYYSGERVYMAVRFNELVDHHVSYATVNIGGTNYTFTYSGGDYTNTLYFYCDNITTTSTSGITGTITLKSIGGYVNDMSGNSRYLSNLNYTVSNFKMYPSYSVTLNTNGGTINGSKVSKYTYTQGCSLPTNVTRTGYTFGGWYANSNFSGSAVTTISTTDSGNKTYYAKWIANTYTVSLNTNGGTLASAQNVTSYTYATTVTLPTPTKVGYTFSGWYANSSFTGSRINSISSTDIGNKQYWAKWTVNTYYILYNGSGNTSGSMTKTTCTYNVGTTLTKNAFVKTGYTFQGWATSATATSAAYTDEQSIINLTAENGANINLYALWNANQYTISLDQQDATVNGTTQITVFFDAQPQSIQPPTKIGYGFDGFFTQPYGEGEQYYTSAGNPLITAYKVAENLELYAKWTARDYIITYNNEGGTITTENYVTTYTYGTMVTLPSIERNGCTFGGWFTNQNCEGAAVTEIEASEYGDKVFYAKWTPITYDVALNENGGQIKSGKVSHYTFGIGAILPTAMNMKRDGHTFAGWYDNEELSGDAINAISVADYGDKEYWAKWEEGAYVVTLQTNGGTINSGNIVSYKYQTGAALPTNVTKTGYTFAGWYENSSCLGTSVSEITDSDMGDKSYWAKWIENVYDVSFHENEGTINNNVVIENYTFSVGASLPADVTRKGYSFGGWYDNEECSGNPVTLITTTEYGEKEFWAKWDIINYSITFNNNGGTFSIQEIPSSYQLGTEITLPRQISREGYTFDGWYDNSNFTNTEISRIENDEVGNKLFYAKWLVNTYDITLNTNEGTINSGNVANYTYGYGISLPSDVTKPGYSFAGWYADEHFTTARITRVSETMSGNLVFYAKWTENTYSITLNVNDGTIAEEYVSNYTYGMGSTLPTNVTRQGYTFMGWFVNSNFDGSAVKAVSATEYGDKTFWAKWQVETYTVTLQTNGGTINAGNISGYMFGVGAELPSDVTKTGHSFVGWYADEDFNSAEFSAIAVNETGDKTFYAKWTVDNYSISYNINGGMINEGELDEYTYGFGAELPTDVTRTGYTFVGWYDNVNLIGTPFTEITEEDFGNKSFYAKWNTNIYAIEYDVNGGTINSGNVTSYQYGSDVILPTDVTRQGYTFTGWHFVAQDMTEEEGAVAIMQVSSIDFGDKTYYAWWTNNTYTITYFADQGTINEEPTITYTYGEVTTLPTDVTREGYTFAGWFSNSSYSGSSVLTVPATETGNKEFWARWEVNSYAVTLDVDGGDINSGNVASYTYNVLTILPQDVTKVGHTFEGWFDSENQKVTQISKGTIGDVTFTAHWTAKTYGVTLQTNNGTINAGNVTSYTFGTAVILPTKEQITKTGYEFLGWYDNSSCTGTAQTEISADATGNKSFWAKWTVNSYTVTLNANGGTINNGNVTNYTYGVGATLPADVTKTGYAFKGWYDNDEFAGEAITTVANNETGDKTYYAKFTVNTYNVILVTNEGVINSGNIETYEFGTGATLPTDVTKTGYTFDGWYSNSSYIGGPVSSIAGNDMGDKQFWAKWTINEYEVTATAENGTVEGTGSYEYKSPATLKAVPNEGYEFVGWNDNEVTDARIQFVVTKDTTLVANFKEKEKVQISGTLEIPTLKTERESAPIDLAGLFTTSEGGEVTYSATSSAPNVVAATVSEGKLFLTVYEYEGEAEITVTATLPNGEKNSVKATANVVLACNIQVEETITNVSCFGESDGEIALKVTNAAEPYTTKWENETSLEDTIRNIVAGNYSVVITDNENCVYNKTYTVIEPAEMTMKASVKNPTCENADGSISIVLTGAENATFAWSNEATTQNIASLEKGDYSVVITNTETGCQISDSYTLVEPTAPVVTVSNVISTACNEKSGAVIISGDDNLIYHWNNGRSTKNLLNVNAGDYTLVVTDENNCTATLDVTVPSIPLKQPEIALVTVSEQTGKNLVVWLKENTDLIDFYTIYRESERKDVFEALATVPYSELSVYEDEEADPNIQPWRYKISATDVCGEETAMSEYHTTMHIAKVAGADTEENKNQTNLIWNAYEGIDYESFIVMCKHKENGKILVDTLATLSANFTSYTVDTAINNVISYYVGVKLPEVVNPKTQFLKAESGPFSLAISNIAEVENVDVAIDNTIMSNVEVYSIGHRVYVKNAEEKSITLFNNSGRALECRKAEQSAEEFNVRLAGVYFVKVDGESFAVIVR